MLHCCTQFCDLLVLLTDELRDQVTVGLQLKIDRERERLSQLQQCKQELRLGQ